MKKHTSKRVSLNALAGAAAGFLATIPMSAVMGGLRLILPEQRTGPLPPTRITHRVVHEVSGKSPGGPSLKALTLVSHFAYGAGTGALYPLFHNIPGPLYGFSIWAASYLGWLPSLGLFPSATRQSRSRNLMMITAHLVWGLVTERVYRAASGVSEPEPSLETQAFGQREEIRAM